MSKIEVDKVDPQSGTALEIGTSGDTVTVPSGVGLTLTNSTLLLPTTVTATTEVKTNKISPATGTAFALGDSGDTFTVPSGATLANLGTATGFAGISWQSVETGATFTAVAGNGYPVNTTAQACTVTLPASASVGDQITFTDYARKFATNALTIDQNSLNYQGASDTNPIYSTDGESIHIVYMDATQGWIPLYDGAVSYETAPTTDILFKMWGGGGGGSDGPDGAAGSPGGYVAATVPVTVSSTVYVVVGSGGGKGSSGYAGGGGGYSGIFKTSGTPDIANAQLMVGGGGGGARSTSANGGAGGGTTGGAGYATDGLDTALAGQGGTQSDGGAAATNAGNQEAGTALTGGFGKSSPGGFSNGGQVVYGGGADGGGDNATYTAGGGGGGYYGGGGAASAGGGGGSSFVAYAGTSSVTNTQGTRVSGASEAAAPNNGDAEYVSGVGVGGAGTTEAVGGNGLVAYSINSGVDWTTFSYTGSIQSFTAPAS